MTLAAPVPWTRPWHGIAEPLWSGSAADIKEGVSFARLAPIWQMFLLGDGAPTRHLQLLTQGAIGVEVTAMADVGMDNDGAPTAIEAIEGPRTRRQVWLRSEKTGEVFSHATSWWTTARIRQHLQNPQLPIWASLNQRHAELYRDLQGLSCGFCPALEPVFGPGPYWSRHYLLWHGGQPLTLIYEVYAPQLTKYLGPAALPGVALPAKHSPNSPKPAQNL